MGAMPKLLLLGDSIRMSYQPHVARLLEGRATTVGPAENCCSSVETLSSLDRWIGETGKPDIVHWNNGIWDSGHNPARTPVQIPVGSYRNNLEAILGKLRELTPNVVWATTTPVHPARPFQASQWAWRNAEINHYNAVARELMEANAVPINDLHRLVWADADGLLDADQLHLSAAGQKACARAVAAAVQGFLNDV